jgi:uroporphyrinogen-III synthase
MPLPLPFAPPPSWFLLNQGNAENLAKLIIERMGGLGPSAPPLLFLCGDKRRDTLPTLLNEAEIPFLELKVYETRAVPEARGRVDAFLGSFEPDWVVLFSPSLASSVLATPLRHAKGRAGEGAAAAEGGNGGEEGQAPLLAAIGKTTETQMAALGSPPQKVAARPTPSSLADALCS